MLRRRAGAPAAVRRKTRVQGVRNHVDQVTYYVLLSLNVFLCAKSKELRSNDQTTLADPENDSKVPRFEEFLVLPGILINPPLVAGKLGGPLARPGAGTGVMGSVSKSAHMFCCRAARASSLWRQVAAYINAMRSFLAKFLVRVYALSRINTYDMALISHNVKYISCSFCSRAVSCWSMALKRRVAHCGSPTRGYSVVT